MNAPTNREFQELENFPLDGIMWKFFRTNAKNLNTGEQMKLLTCCHYSTFRGQKILHVVCKINTNLKAFTRPVGNALM